MKLTITGRNLKVTEGIEDHLNQKLSKLMEIIEDSADVHVALQVEKHRHHAEITVKAKGFSVHGESETDDLYAAMDQTIQKIEKQVKKHRERHKSKKVKQNLEEKSRHME